MFRFGAIGPYVAPFFRKMRILWYRMKMVAIDRVRCQNTGKNNENDFSCSIFEENGLKLAKNRYFVWFRHGHSRTNHRVWHIKMGLLIESNRTVTVNFGSRWPWPFRACIASPLRGPLLEKGPSKVKASSISSNVHHFRLRLKTHQ